MKGNHQQRPNRDANPGPSPENENVSTHLSVSQNSLGKRANAKRAVWSGQIHLLKIVEHTYVMSLL